MTTMKAAIAGPEQKSRPPYLLLLLLSSYLLMKPIYVFPSGYPQPADGLLCLAAIAAAFSNAVAWTTPVRSATAVGVVLAGYMCVVNLYWSLILSDTEVAGGATFYAFNIMLFVVVLRATIQKDPTSLRWIGYTTAAGLTALALGSLALNKAGAFRQTLLFNNPNQLGYWVLLSATIFLLCSNRVRFRPLVQVTAMLSSAYLAALSLSKATMISLFVLYCLHFFKNPRVVLAMVFAAGIGIAVLGDTELADKVTSRLENIGQQKDDSAAARGYDRIWTYPIYLILGAGEGAIYRFKGATHELHSTIGTVLFSYGVIGLGLFCYWLAKIGRVAGFMNLSYMFPLLLYGITHQGLRFSLFWFVLALVAAAGVAESRSLAKTPVGVRR